MELGFIKVFSASPKVKVADIDFNKEEILKKIELAKGQGAKVITFPELSLTSSTCGDLFNFTTIQESVVKAIKEIKEKTVDIDALILIGAPIKVDSFLYNAVVILKNGKVLALIPKKYTFSESKPLEERTFATYKGENKLITFLGEQVLFGNKIILKDKNLESFSLSAEVGEDLFSLTPPSIGHAKNGANIICNLSSLTEIVGRREERLKQISAHSSKTLTGYIYTESGDGESTADGVYSANSMIFEKGKCLTESKPFENKDLVTEIDVDFLQNQKKNFKNFGMDDDYTTVYFESKIENTLLTRSFKKTPFVPENTERLENILRIQAEGLKKRIVHTYANKIVLGLSGGLDSTLALIVAVKAMELAGRSIKDVLAVTMPCFGTTSRTLDNSISLAKAYKVSLKKVDITKSVVRHLKDIGHEEGVFDVSYENAQARERTQVLMDIANMNGGLVLGTGDLSELALGWATYNGDHMSMYSVNAGVSKTLARALVEYVTSKERGKLKAVLLDILSTPVSPELLPSKEDEIAQKTEDVVGPYILHDFFLYNMLRKGYTPKKIYYIAVKTFKDEFTKETIYHWLETFIKRFFVSQFKRSCVPDGVKIGTVGFSPRGDFMIPSDASRALWLKDLESIKE
ncbi:MAG: NAD(+) synthase [Clostridiales bacterium]|nr:NAD(+) synthase [Clostridiales bacterium]